MFVTHMGGPLEPTNVNRAWYAVRSRAQLGSLRLHDLRHSCASFLLAAGASPRTVMKTLGHSQIAQMMNTYTHVLPEIEREAIDAAAKVIFECEEADGKVDGSGRKRTDVKSRYLGDRLVPVPVRHDR